MRRTNFIFGRRIQGNLGPTQTDPLSQLPGKIMAPCVNITGTEQDIYLATVAQNYAFGSRMVVDERTFRYCRAGGILGPTQTYRLSISADQCLQDNDRFPVAAIAGDLVVVVDITAAGCPWGAFAFQGGTVGLNELAGGWLEIWTIAGGPPYMHRRIVGNTASIAGAPATITITLEQPLTWPINAGPANWVSIQHNIYRNVQNPGLAGLVGFQSAVCLAPIEVANGRFFWGQTWGPCFVAPRGPGWPGGVVEFRDVYLWQDGTIVSSQALGIGVGADNSPMRVGYALPAGNYGTGMIMLQLAP